MSDPALERGLLATCVASRCQVLDDPEDRKLVWFLQKLSWQSGGLEKVLQEVVDLWPERFRSEKMQALGVGLARKYSQKETSEIFEAIARHPCTHMPIKDDSSAFLIRLHFSSATENHVCSLLSADTGSNPEDLSDDDDRERRTAMFASKISASVFERLCRDAALDRVDGTCGLADFIFKRICLDPSLAPGDWKTWYLPTLRETLLDYQRLCIERAAEGLALTKVTEKTFEALDYALEMRGLVLIQGLERRGKTFSAKTWCDLHPGEARYVKTPSTSDDGGFFREIARSLGIGCGQTMKTVEIRDRIESVLLGGDLMLVFDNAHFLFRQAMYREAVPQRITWILTALKDEKIPVAFISTPQFTIAQQLTAEKSKWREAQLSGRIDHFEPLPETLSTEDLAAVARAWIPNASTEMVDVLVTYAEASDKYIQAIGSLAQRAIYLAKKGGRLEPTIKDIKEALQTGVIPSDNAIGAAIEEANARVHPRARRRSSTAARVKASRVRTEAATQPASLSGVDRVAVAIGESGSGLIPDKNFTRASAADLRIESDALT